MIEIMTTPTTIVCCTGQTWAEAFREATDFLQRHPQAALITVSPYIKNRELVLDMSCDLSEDDS